MDTQAHLFSHKQLLEILSLSQNATAIYTNENLLIQSANDEMIGFWGKNRSVVGKPLQEAVPELPGQPIYKQLQNVWRTGITYIAKDAAATLLVNGQLQTFYFDLTYRAIKNELGQVYCILHTATDVTELNLGREIIARAKEQKEALDKEQELNEELAAANEELRLVNNELLEAQNRLYHLNTQLEKKVLERTSELLESKMALQHTNNQLQAANEEQTTINEELHLLNQQLFDSRAVAQQSESMLNLAINAAQFGTWHIDRQTRKFIASSRLKELFGFYPHEEVTLAGCIAQITDDYQEKVAKAVEKAIVEGGNYNLTYKVCGYHNKVVRWIKAVGNLAVDKTGEFSVFTGVLMDITHQVQAQRAEQELNEELTVINEELRATNEELMEAQKNYIKATDQSEKARAELLFTIDAANLGTFDLNLATNHFKINDLLAQWSGLVPGKEVSLEAAVGTVAAYDQERLMKAVMEASQFELGGRLDVEYTIINASNPVPKMVRARGKMFFNDKDEPLRLSGILQDITEQKRDEQRKDDFINMVSHELKTPLTSMSGYIQILNNRANKAGDTFTAGTLQKSYNQIKKMTTLINGFLNMSRLESGRIHLDITVFDIEALVQEIIEESSIVFSLHHIYFNTCASTIVRADYDKIGQVITNFISNAVKYAFSNKTIEITCTELDGQVTVSVTDYGNGIEMADQEKIFERYYRVQNDRKGTIAGFGIGLYLCKEIIDRHHGQIGVKSEAGKGATFYFTLPVLG